MTLREKLESIAETTSERQLIEYLLNRKSRARHYHRSNPV
jgi:hypothetical protein